MPTRDEVHNNRDCARLLIREIEKALELDILYCQGKSGPVDVTMAQRRAQKLYEFLTKTEDADFDISPFPAQDTGY